MIKDVELASIQGHLHPDVIYYPVTEQCKNNYHFG